MCALAFFFLGGVCVSFLLCWVTNLTVLCSVASSPSWQRDFPSLHFVYYPLAVVLVLSTLFASPSSTFLPLLDDELSRVHHSYFCVCFCHSVSSPITLTIYSPRLPTLGSTCLPIYHGDRSLVFSFRSAFCYNNNITNCLCLSVTR